MTRLYVFIREGMFYPLELRDDADARANAECNPGTLRVEDVGGRVVWRAPGPERIKPAAEDGR